MKEETKQKISVSNKGKSHISPIKNKSLSDEHKRKLSLLKQTPILQYNLEGNFIKEWNSVQEAIKNTGLKHIADCLLGRCKRCGKYIWRKKTPKYIDDHSRIIPLYLLEDLSIYKKKTRLTSTKQPSEKLKQALDKAHAKNKKKIDQFSLDGVFLKTWDSISEAAMRYGVSIGAISSCLNGRNNTCVKCIWKYNLQSGNK